MAYYIPTVGKSGGTCPPCPPPNCAHGVNANGFLKRFQPLTLKWLDPRFPNVFERDPNLSLVNTSRPKPQTTYERNDYCMDDFWQQVAKFAFNVSNLLFSRVPTLQIDIDKQWQRWKCI